MRSDLNKQLCERERQGHDRKYRDVRRLRVFDIKDPDGTPVGGKESMKTRHNIGWNRKSFNENLNPLWGAVRKAVGRPWNKFYSELCENFDKRSVINQHILDHLFQYVEVDTIFIGEDGQLWVRNTYRAPSLLKDSGTEYYVDPRDGILKHNKHYKTYRQISRERAAQRAKEEAKVFRDVGDGTVVRFIDGVWFQFEMKKIPKGRYVYDKPRDKDVFQPYSFTREKTWDQLTDFEKQKCGVARFTGDYAKDIFTGELVFIDERGILRRKASFGTHTGTYKNNLYHASKKTASHKLLKKLGLV